MALLDELQKVARLNGDTYSSAEVMGLVKKAAAEIEQLTAALKVARQWMPVHPIPNTGAIEDCAVVDAALNLQ